jgi:hypothetical protein
MDMAKDGGPNSSVHMVGGGLIVGYFSGIWIEFFCLIDWIFTSQPLLENMLM